jgi:hypothetical protein
VAAQILRMDHSLMSRHGLNDDFFRSDAVLIRQDGENRRDELLMVFLSDFSGVDGPKY